MRLRFVRSRRNAHVKDVSTSLLGDAVGPLQCVLQVSEEIGVADEDVQAADAPGVAAGRAAPLTVIRDRAVSSPTAENATADPPIPSSQTHAPHTQGRT
jgi:hypothetical protein